MMPREASPQPPNWPLIIFQQEGNLQENNKKQQWIAERWVTVQGQGAEKVRCSAKVGCSAKLGRSARPRLQHALGRGAARSGFLGGLDSGDSLLMLPQAGCGGCFLIPSQPLGAQVSIDSPILDVLENSKNRCFFDHSLRHAKIH